MNYLAHIYLARQSGPAMLGALLGDFAKANVAGKFGPEVEREILIHRKVDSYTDSHPLVKEALQKFDPVRRRFAGIMLDMFYDHVLAKNWEQYCATTLPEFAQNFYRVLDDNAALLPERLARMAPYMIKGDWLTSYRDYASVELAVNRMSQRLSRNDNLLRDCLQDARAHYAYLCDSFLAFFPDLIRFAEAQRAAMKNEMRPFQNEA
jgi:acyl carrier protein phosphodiesterase